MVERHQRARRAAGAFALATALAMVPGAPPASATQLHPGPSPLAFTTGSACPAAADVSGATAAQGIAQLLAATRRAPDEDSARYLVTMAIGSALSEESGAVVLCDPEAAQAGRALGPIEGDLAGAVRGDVAMPGLRGVVAEQGSAAATLGPGDRVSLPMTGPGATLDVAVRTPSGVDTMRLGPFAGAPTSLTIAGTTELPRAVVTLEDGTTIEQAAHVPALPNPALGVMPRGRRLVLRVRDGVGALVLADRPRPTGGDSMDNLRGFDAIGSVPATGKLRMTSGQLDPGSRSISISTFDLVHQTGATWNCALCWRRARISRARCAAERASRDGLATAARLKLTRPVRRAPASAAVPPAGTASRAESTAAATSTSIARVPYWASPETSDDLLAADLTGDGRPEVITTGYTEEHALWVSGPNGWRRAKLKDAPGEIATADDLTGDGRADLWLAAGRTVGGRADWSTGATPTLDLRDTAPLGPLDLSIDAMAEDDAFEAIPPTPLGDTTGDGRPELLVSASAVYASERLPLGSRTRVPYMWAPRTAEGWATDARIFSNVLTDTLPEALLGDSDLDGGMLVVPQAGGGARRVLTAVARQDGQLYTTLALERLDPSAGWTPSQTGSSVFAGLGAVVDHDAAHDEFLVRTAGEACRAKRCVMRLRRVDGTGRVLGTASWKGPSSADLDAFFIADGSDRDDRPEVAVRRSAGESFGHIGLWSSAAPTTAILDLPVLAGGGAPLNVTGPLVPWRASGQPGGLVALDGEGEHQTLLAIDLAR